MPAYEAPFAGAGAAAGGGLLGVLGRLLSPLDYPRQALYNLGRAGANALSGEGTWADALRAVPGALGAGLAGGLTATGFGAPLGILAGSALGGLAQGVGRAADRDTFEAPTAEDLAKKLGLPTEGIAGFLSTAGLGMATDPLTFAGGLGGAAKGGKFGKELEAAAQVRGPMYPGGAEKLAALDLSKVQNNPMIRGMPDRVKAMLASPEAPRILGEIPPGSQFLGAGVEGVALRTPQGDVLRVGRPTWDPSVPPAPRVQHPDVLQPTRDIVAGTHRIERVPMAESTGSLGSDQMSPRAYADFIRSSKGLSKGIVDSGYLPVDMHSGNIGKIGGRTMVIDPGAVVYPSNYLPRERMPTKEPSALQERILSMLGSDRSVRNEIESASQAAAGKALGAPIPQDLQQILSRGADERAVLEKYLGPGGQGSGSLATQAGLQQADNDQMRRILQEIGSSSEPGQSVSPSRMVGQPPENGVVPALKDRGGKVYYGDFGDTHDVLAKRHGVASHTPGYADRSGRFYTKSEMFGSGSP